MIHVASIQKGVQFLMHAAGLLPIYSVPELPELLAVRSDSTEDNKIILRRGITRKKENK